MDDLIVQFQEKTKSTDEQSIETQQDLVPIISKLENHFWTMVEKVVVRALGENPDQIVLNKYDRLLTDLGMLDQRLIKNIEDIRIDMLKELYEHCDSVFYFSSWLANRYRLFLLYGELDDENISEQTGENKTVASYKQARRLLYNKVRHLFSNLPGFSEKVIELLFNGKLDETIDGLSSQLGQKENITIALQRKQLIEIKTKITSRAKERATNSKEQDIFDALAKIDVAIEQKKQTLKSSQTMLRREISPIERVNFIKGELKLVRQLLKLGIPGSGLTRTHSVLLSRRKRLTKSATDKIFQRARESDPYLPESINILIAPYIGTGFYEWDRDTIFVPLLPTQEEEEAVVTGLANYKIMVDMLRDSSRVKKLYEMRFGKPASTEVGQDFRTNFVRDYKAWLLGIGKGHKGTMEAEHYDFFRSYLGPHEQDLFAPVEITKLTAEQRRQTIKDCLSKINRAEGTFYDHYKLAVVFWKELRPSDALKEMSRAVKINPIDGRAMFSLGYLCTLATIKDKARDAFNECTEIAKDTIWYVYANEALQKL